MDTNLNPEVAAEAQITESTVVAKKKQKEALFEFVNDTLAGRARTEGQAVRDLLSKEDKKAIKQRLIDGIKAGTIEYKKSMEEKALKKYCSCLVSHWLKKDARYN